MNKLLYGSAVSVIFLAFAGCSNQQQNIKYSIGKNGNLIVEKYNAGKIESRISYLSDTATKDGKSIYYQEGKNIEKIEHWNNGKLAGSYIQYERDTPVLFICHDSYGDTIFLRTFSGRKIISEAGNMLPHGVLETDNLNKDGTVRYVGFIVAPPYVGIKVKNYVVNTDNNDTLKPIRTEEEYGWVNYSTFKVTNDGNYKFRQVVYLTDSLKGMLTLRIVDTAMFQVPK